MPHNLLSTGICTCTPVQALVSSCYQALAAFSALLQMELSSLGRTVVLVEQAHDPTTASSNHAVQLSRSRAHG